MVRLIEGIAKIVIGDKAIELGRAQIKIEGFDSPKEAPECNCDASEHDLKHIPTCPLCTSATIEITVEK